MKTQEMFLSNTTNNFSSFSKTSSMVRLIKSGLSTVYAFALVMALTLTARATENTVAAAKESVKTVQLKTVEHNLEAVVAALRVIDPAWEKGLRTVKANKAKRRTQHADEGSTEVDVEAIATRLKALNADRVGRKAIESAGFAAQQPLVWFGVSADDCDELINPMAYPFSPENPEPPEGQVTNPNGCPDTGEICCARGYAPSSLTLTNIGGNLYWTPPSSAAYVVEVNKPF